MPKPDRPSASAAQEVTPTLLRQWALPEAGQSKYGRGQILVVGGGATTPEPSSSPGLRRSGSAPGT